MPRVRVRALLRREPLVLALAAYDLWRRLPPRQRKLVLKLARKHGPKLVSRAIKQRAKRR